MSDRASDKTSGSVCGVNGNVIVADCAGVVELGEVAYVVSGDRRLKAEVVRIRGCETEMQLFERADGIMVGDAVEYSGEPLSVELAPGLLNGIFDGLQNPIRLVAEEVGYFLERGRYFYPLSTERRWAFTAKMRAGDAVHRGAAIGSVPEGIFEHKIMAPFDIDDVWTITDIASDGGYTIHDSIATIASPHGESRNITMTHRWPAKRAIAAYRERIFPSETLVTGVRIIDSLIPVAIGGTYCIPGPFGAGKTVLQQITSRNASVDIVIIAACGERAGEVVETLREFPELVDPRTGRALMERTVLIINTSSMPVAAREASVYTAITIAEYYRQMGLHVLLLADSTSRWAQAMRELSGRLEEIPGEEAFPAYLESVIASFYERAGVVQLGDGATGSVTIGGTVSPAGGNFEEPVTQATLKVVGAFHGLSRERSDARKYPAIDPLESWSKYTGLLDREQVTKMEHLLARGDEIRQMMKVIGEEGVGIHEHVIFLKSELLDTVYLQQNAFDKIDSSVSPERQRFTYGLLERLFDKGNNFTDKEEARSFFYRLQQRFIDYNYSEWQSDDAKQIVEDIEAMIAQACGSE